MIRAEQTISGGVAVSTESFWISVGSESAAAWLHTPAEGRARGSGVLICPPLGHEYTHTHRTLRTLANTFAARGYLTMRLDYPGTGDSSGDETTAGLFDLWVASADEAVERLEALTGGRVTLVGLRLGATIGSVVAARRDVEHLVAWNPVVSGRRYIREQEAYRRLSDKPVRDSDGLLDVGGFCMAAKTADAVKSESILRRTHRIRGEALLVERDDLESDGELRGHLERQSVSTTVIHQSDYLDMVAEPQYTVVPEATIQRIVEWAEDRDAGVRIEVERDAISSLPKSRKAMVEGWSEELVTIGVGGDAPLSGVLSTPLGEDLACGPVVLLVNAGSVHHVGPNRFYVELARGLASVGVASLRFDIRNLGDSVRRPTPYENHPYPDTAVEDVRLAAEWLEAERGCDSFVLAGLCSGAHAVFHAAVELTTVPIAAVVPINPLTFYWHEGMSLETPDTYQTIRDAKYYGRAIKDLGSWTRLVRGHSNLGYIALFVARRIGQVVGAAGRRAIARLGLVGPTPLARDLGRLHDRGRRIHFVFSADDPGYEILKAEASYEVTRLSREGTIDLTLIPNADHTFSRKPQRTEAVRALVDWTAGARQPAR